MLIFCMLLQVINIVKVIHQDEGHIKVKGKISTSLPILCHLFCVCIYLKWLKWAGHVKVNVKVKVK